MKKQLLTLFFLIAVLTGFSQNVNFNWAAHMGSSSNDLGFTVKTDFNGNVYTVGMFWDTVDFDPDTSVYNLTSNGSLEMFIQKLDANGKLLWATSIGGNNLDRASDIDFDLNGNLLITGMFEDTVDFDPGTSVHNLISSGSIDIFVLKLDATGGFIWAKTFGGLLNDIPNSITIDKNGNSIVTGLFRGIADFDPDSNSTYQLTSAGSPDVFIQKLDSNGNFVWANRFGGSSTDYGLGVETDLNGNVYTVGRFRSNVDFDPGSGTARLINQGGDDIFIQKLDPNGNLLWVRGMGDTFDDWAYSVAIDKTGNVLTTGFFNGTVDFNTDTSGTYNLTSSGDRDIFIQKLDSNGNFLWAKTLGSTGDDVGYSILIDTDNNIYTTGSFEGTVNFNTDSIGIHNLSSNGKEDVFIQKLDANGNFIWAETIGGADIDRARSVYIDQNRSILATGSFESTVDFDPDTLSTNNLSSNGGWDIFVLKLDQCDNYSDSLAPITCDTYTSPSGKIWTQSGVYLDTVFNSGCDSLFTINLNVISIDTSLTIVNHVKITANDSLTNYQWIDCNNNNVPISGDTNRSFIATANGNYAVVLENNGCVDTSACVPILSVGISETASIKSSINLYPNPNKGNFTIEVDKSLIAKTYQVLDIKGSLIKEGRFTNSRTLIDLSGYRKGIYFLRIRELGVSKKIVVNE